MLIVVLLLMFIPVNRMIFGQISKTDHSLSLNALYPNLKFSTFLGGNLDEIGGGIAVSADGSFYVTGFTRSNNFPILNPYSSYIGHIDYFDVFVSKFSASGFLLWSTYLGGISTDYAEEITVDSEGNCYVVGSTDSFDFPTLNAYNNMKNGSRDAFISKFSSDGSLLWSTYFGGNDYDHGHDIFVVNDGCYIIGDTFSDNLPSLNAYDNTIGGERDIFIAKFSTNGSLLWDTYLGGKDWDIGYGITAIDAESCYVTGFTRSSDFPTLNTNSTYVGSTSKYDTFISKFSASGLLLWSAYLGGDEGDYGYDIAVTTDGCCYLTGMTSSSNFPTLNAYNNSFGGVSDIFISKFNTNGSLLWSTFLGGNEDDYGYGIDVTNNGDCYITGKTCSNNFPTLNALNSFYCGGTNDIFIAKFSLSGSLLWSTYLGGNNDDCGYDIAIANDGSCHLTGCTFSSNFPILNNYTSTLGSDLPDAFVTKINETATPPNQLSAYGFLGFIIVIPILTIINRIKKKKKKLNIS